MPQNTLVGRVMYRSPIPVGTLFAPPTAWHAPQGVEHSDQTLGTRITRGPRRLEWHVKVSQGHRGHPADTSVGKGLGMKFTTTKLTKPQTQKGRKHTEQHAFSPLRLFTECAALASR